MDTLLARIKMLVIGLALGLLCVPAVAQGPGVSPGLNYFRGIAGSATQPTYTYLNDSQTGTFLVTVGKGGFSATKVYVGDWTSTRFNFFVPLQPNTTNTLSLGTSASEWSVGYFQSGVQFGPTASTTGLVRLTNTGTISSRNGAGTADLVMMFLGSDNAINLGNASSTGLRLGTGIVSRPTTGSWFLCISTTGVVTASSNACSGS